MLLIIIIIKLMKSTSKIETKTLAEKANEKKQLLMNDLQAYQASQQINPHIKEDLAKIAKVMEKVNSIQTMHEEHKSTMDNVKEDLNKMKKNLKEFMKDQNVKFIKTRAQQSKTKKKEKKKE